MTGAMHSVDPVVHDLWAREVRAACRVLARVRYPLHHLDELPDDPASTWLRARLHATDLPLTSLRSALRRLEERLVRSEPRSTLRTAQPQTRGAPELLAGDSACHRAARTVYQARLCGPELAVLPAPRRERLALLEALEFRDSCEALAPPAGKAPSRADPRDEAARHAWAQCFAREVLEGRQALGPSTRCAEAAALARRLVERMDPVEEEGGE